MKSKEKYDPVTGFQEAVTFYKNIINPVTESLKKASNNISKTIEDFETEFDETINEVIKKYKKTSKISVKDKVKEILGKIVKGKKGSEKTENIPQNINESIEKQPPQEPIKTEEKSVDKNIEEESIKSEWPPDNKFKTPNGEFIEIKQGEKFSIGISKGQKFPEGYIPKLKIEIKKSPPTFRIYDSDHKDVNITVINIDNVTGTSIWQIEIPDKDPIKIKVKKKNPEPEKPVVSRISNN